jgi:dienelactone hydrolase
LRAATLLGLLLLSASAPQGQAAGRDVDIPATDGVRIRGTYVPAARRGPGVVLLHMCNTTRESWTPVAQQLAAAGISALAIDNRGFGESGGPRMQQSAPEVQRQVRARWPDDFDAALAWLAAQPEVDGARIGAAGGSCGVDNAIKLASRHRNVRSLVLLAGETDPAGVTYLRSNPWLPIFAAAAADDQYDRQAPQLMRWFTELSGNPRNRFVGFEDGRHGTEIFGPHPELPKQIVEWFEDTLIENAADPAEAVTRRPSAASEFWAAATAPDGALKAAQLFRDARSRDPEAFLFPESMLNQIAYARLQKGDATGAVELFKLNAEASPKSANAQDSLADGYLATGQHELALAAAEKCLALLPGDTIPDPFKAAVRQAAEEKIAKLKRALNR